MISALVLLTLGLLGMVHSLLYAVVGKGPQQQILQFQSGRSIKAASEKAGFSWSSLRFDRARNPLEVLALPDRVLRRHLTTAQIVDILMNPQLKHLTLRKNEFLTKELSKGGLSSKRGGMKLSKKSIRRAIGRRLGFFRQRLPEVNLTTVSGREQADQVVEAISPQAYEQMSPLMALTSPRFQATLKNIAHLFGLTLRVLRVTIPHLIPIVLDIIKQIVSVLHHGKRENSNPPTTTVSKLVGIDHTKFNTPALHPFHVATLLLSLLEKYPILGKLMGSRVDLLVKELQDLLTNLKKRLFGITQKMTKFKELRSKRLLSNPQHEFGRGDQEKKINSSPTLYEHDEAREDLPALKRRYPLRRQARQSGRSPI